jgi:5-(carboxyamino)imidazole ribonucleotide synthase
VSSVLDGPATLGVLGGGQLGRMSILAGRRLGLRFAVYEPSPGCPAGMVADREVNAPWDDQATLLEFADACDLVTLEFENVPEAAARLVASRRPLAPSAEVLLTCQHRGREKTFLRDRGFPVAPFALARSPADVAAALAQLGAPAVVKTCTLGYDGKGQEKVSAPSGLNPAALWARLGSPPEAIVEAWIPHQLELSVITARSASGEVRTFAPMENEHRDHILHRTIVPARIPERVAREAVELGEAIAEALELVGLVAVELFLDPVRGLLVNELAPRPHNSGHWSLDGAVTSQFEQHVRAVAGLPLGDPSPLAPAVMVNLLGDRWLRAPSGHPAWDRLLEDRGLKLHLYDKGRPRPGRKMGHFTVLDADPARALARAEAAEARLLGA